MGNRALGPGQDLRGLSQALWGEAPLDLMQGFGDPDIGWMAGDDFKNYSLDIALSSNVGYSKSEGNVYRTFESNGGSGTSAQCIVPSNSPWTVPTGFNLYTPTGGQIVYPAGTVIPTPGQITFNPTATTDQAQIVLAPNIAGTTNVPTGMFTPYPISSGAQGDVIFEIRFRLSGLTTSFTSFFVGLVGAGAAVGLTTNPVGASAFSTVPSLLGFGALKGDPSMDIGLVWNKAGGTVQSQYMSAALTPLNLLTMGGLSSITPTTSPATSPNLFVGGPGGINQATPATYAGAYLKLGFRYNAAAGTLTPYINGVAQDGRSGPNKVVSSAGIAGSLTYGGPGITSGTGANLWPADQMTFGAGLYQTGTTYQTLTIDWWRCCQLVGN